MRGLCALVLVVGCYAPKAQPGSPCDGDHPCPGALVCSAGTCQDTSQTGDAGGDARDIDARPIDAPPMVGCTPTGFDICNDGIDQDCVDGDAVCVTNDTPAGAIDATAGGTFNVDMLLARDDVANNGCGGDGGRDVFYTITLPKKQVYYFDTFGSDHDTSVRVFPGLACGAITSATMPVCNDDSCGGGQSQLAVSLPIGTSCVVIDQNSAATTGGLALHVVPAGRDGTSLGRGMQSHSGNTCMASSVSNSTAGCSGTNGAKDIAYFVLACPNETLTVDATTCDANSDVNFDTVIYVHTVGVTDDLDCSDDDPDCSVDTVFSTLSGVSVPAGPGLSWVVVDGYDTGDCGAYTLVTTVN